ncbi:MAG: TerB family tellurite resistance protein [Bacteroidota bacterium]
MFEDYENNATHKKSIIALLYKMVKADGGIAPIEKQYLFDIAKNIGLDTASVKEVVRNPDAYQLETPTDEQDRMTIMYYLLFMMRVDGKILPAEEKLVYEAGFRLGFNELLVRDLIKVMKQYLDAEIPPEEMLKHVRKYLN